MSTSRGLRDACTASLPRQLSRSPPNHQAAVTTAAQAALEEEEAKECLAEHQERSLKLSGSLQDLQAQEAHLQEVQAEHQHHIAEVDHLLDKAGKASAQEKDWVQALKEQSQSEAGELRALRAQKIEMEGTGQHERGAEIQVEERDLDRRLARTRGKLAVAEAALQVGQVGEGPPGHVLWLILCESL